ncbi:MAG: 5-exo-hydroxycamphor dehydrogenase [Planctomycetota bacterium]
MTRVALFQGPGRPFELATTPLPEPHDGEILVRIACATICRSDLHTHAGRRAGPLPSVLGHEAVGRIVSFGEGCTRADFRGAPASRGDRITWSIAVGCGACHACLDGLPQKCDALFKYGHQRHDPDAPSGGLAEHIVLRRGTAWFRVPDGLDDALAATSNCAFATAAAALRAGDAARHRTVVVVGAGMVGLAACAMARAAGAEAVIACDPIESNRIRALRFGATQAVDALETAAAEAARAASNGRGADLVVEAAGSAPSTALALALPRIGGTVVLVGTVAPVGEIAVDPERLVRRVLTVRGMHNYRPDDLAAALEFLAGPGRMHPWHELFATRHALEAVDAAFAEAHARPGQRVAVVPASQDETGR